MFFTPIIYIILCGLVGYFASKKGRNGLGYGFLSFLLSPLVGVIIVLVLGENTSVVDERAVSGGQVKKCEYCAELIKVEAKVCKHCGRDVEAKVKIISENSTRDNSSVLDME